MGTCQPDASILAGSPLITVAAALRTAQRNSVLANIVSRQIGSYRTQEDGLAERFIRCHFGISSFGPKGEGFPLWTLQRGLPETGLLDFLEAQPELPIFFTKKRNRRS